MRYLLFLFALSFFVSCTDTKLDEENSEKHPGTSENFIPNGDWLGKLTIDSTHYIPFNFSVENNTLTIINASERINCLVEMNGDSVYFKIPVFDSEFSAKIESDSSLSGYWYNRSKSNYSMPFHAVINNDKSLRFDHSTALKTADFEGKWECDFSIAQDPYKAIGVFEQYDELATGTFITETGDYRFLQGNVHNDTMYLSCFDGSHAFLFTAYQKGDSLIGDFFSGKHYHDNWVAIKNENFELAHPDSLTHIIPGTGPFTFSFPGVEDATIEYPSEKYNGKVVMVQIFGSWCPNCMDEVKYYSSLFDKYHSEGLEIIGLGFEIPEDLDKRKERIKDLVTQFEAKYDFAVAGKASKEAAREALPQLNHVMSFPTTIFLDRNGIIRKVHTGFYGPGTGVYYNNYTQQTEEFIESLLKESV